MRVLKFIVDGQTIVHSPTCNFNSIVPGTDGYLEAEFLFSSEWIGLKKVVEFTSGPLDKAEMVNESNRCKIPKDIAERSSFNIRVLGKRQSDNYTIKTAKLNIKQNGGK